MGRTYLDRYEIDHEIGRGGMAVVYRGVDLTLNRPVAVKVMHPHLLRRADARERFCREARVIAKLKHENIVEVYDFSGSESGNDPAGDSPDDALIVTELVDGMSLSEFLAMHGPLLPEMAAVVTAIVAGALQHAHENGVVHRDVKPENIMVRADGVLKLMDFGIAHVVDMEHLTVTGAIVGSPAHMSPEQVDGRALDARTDVFSLGTLFFLLASGTLPFVSDTPSGLLRAISEARVPDVRARVRSFPDDLHAILMKMMARDPEYRYQHAAEIQSDIAEVLAGVGMIDFKAEMRQFFASPTVEQANLSHRLCQARVRLARQHLASGRRAGAIREADTACQTDPSCEEAARLLAQIRRSVKSGRAVRMTLISLALAAALVGSWILWYPRPAWQWNFDSEGPWSGISITRRPVDMPVGQRRGMDTDGFSVRPPVRIRPGIVQAGSTPDRKRQEIQEKTSEVTKVSARFPISIHAYPPAVQIRVDGRQAGVGRVEGLLVEAGSHSVVLSHPSCDECRDVSTSINVDAANPPRAPLRMSIEYRDARLTVTGPPGARVFMNNESVARGSTNGVILIPMDRPGQQDFAVKVFADGSQIYSGTVKLQAGKTASIRIN